jgi:hypothetical protein
VIAEPTTTLTDYAMAVQCVAYVVSFRQRLRDADRAPVLADRLYLAGFTLAAAASLAGGTSHGFRAQLGGLWGDVWTLTVWSIVTAFVLIIAGGVRSARWPLVGDSTARASGRRWLALGFGLTAVGLTLLVLRVSLHQHFNQNDLYHVVQIAGLYGVYRGARRLLALD